MAALTRSALMATARVAALLVLGLRLVAADKRWSPAAIGAVPALACAVLVAAALVTEPRRWWRLAMLAAVTLAHAAWMVHDGHWRWSPFWLTYAAITVIGGAVVGLALEARGAAWSIVVAVPLAAFLGYLLLPGYAADVTYRQATWSMQLLLLLIARRV